MEDSQDSRSHWSFNRECDPLFASGRERPAWPLPKEEGSWEAFAFLGNRNLLVAELIIKINGSGVRLGIRKDASGWARPINVRQTYRTWFATAVDGATGQGKRSHVAAGIANGHDFGMSRWIVGGSDTVPAPPDDLPFANNDSSERSPETRLHGMAGEFGGLCQIRQVLLGRQANQVLIQQFGREQIEFERILGW